MGDTKPKFDPNAPYQKATFDPNASYEAENTAAGGDDDNAPEPTEENLPGSTPQLRAAVKSGVAKMTPPTQFETENAHKPYYGFTPGNITKNAVEGAKGMIGGTAQGAYDLMLGEHNPETGQIEEHGLGGLVGMDTKGKIDPLGRVNALTRKYVTDPAVAEYDKGDEQGGLPGLGHKLASAVPLVGPFAAELGEQAGHGDIGGAGGKAAGTFAGGELMNEAPKAGLKIADKVVRGTPMTDLGKIEAAKQQLLTVKKPSTSETEYAQKVNDAMPELQKIAQDNKGNITTPRQAVGAINTRIKQIEAPIAQHLAGLNTPGDLVHPADYQPQINAAVDQALKQTPGTLTPEEIQKAKDSVAKFVGDQPKTYQELEGNRRRLNDDAEKYYTSDTAGRNSIDVSEATAKAQRAAANAIRDVMYGDGTNPGMLERAGVRAVDVNGQPVPIRALRQSVGRLLDIRDHFEDAITRAEAQGDWSLTHVMKSGPSLAAGGLGAGIGGIAGGLPGFIMGTLLGEGGKAWTDYLKSKNPNLNTTKMFRNLNQTAPANVPSVQIGAPTRTPQPQYATAANPVRGALPAPAVAAGYDAGPSGPVRGGRYTTPAGLLNGPNAGLLPAIGETTSGGASQPRGVPMGLSDTSGPVPAEERMAHPMAPLRTPAGPELPPGGQLGNIAAPSQPKPQQLGTLGGSKDYKASEKAATMSAPRKVVPEQEESNWQEETRRNKAILRDPNATPEDKRIAQSRLDEGPTVKKEMEEKASKKLGKIGEKKK